MAKQLVFEDEARQPLAAGVSKLARAVVSTLGPRGRNAVLDKGWGAPKITKDGVTVAKEIELDDPYENLGAQLVKEAASKTADVAGDGTTTATLLAEAIYLEGLRMVAAGADPMALGRGIHAATDAVIEAIEKMASPVNEKDKKEIAQVATIAGNNDPTIGAVLADAFVKVGKNGVITVEEGKQAETTVDVVEGMQFDRGFLSPHFVTNQDEQTRRVREVPDPDPRGQDLQRQEPDPAVGGGEQGRQAAADHRRGRRGRGPGDAGGQQAARHPQRGGREGPGLRRPPQGHAGRHRHADRRQRHLQGPGRDAGFGQAFRPRHGEEGRRRRRQHDDHRRRRQQGGHRRPGRPDPQGDRDHHQRLRSREARRSGWPSWPAAWPRSTSAPPPRRR